MGVPIEVYRCRIGTFQPSLKSIKGTNTTSSPRSSSSIITFLLILISSSFLASFALYNFHAISYRFSQGPYTSAMNTSSLQSRDLSSQWCSTTWRPPWPPPWSAPFPVLAVLLTALQSLHKPCCPVLLHELTISEVGIYSQPQLFNHQGSYCTSLLLPRDNLTESGLAWSHRCHWLTTPATPSSWLTRIQRNDNIKCLNGNRGARGRGIKIVAWNKGSSFLSNRHDEIESLIAGHHPHILGLSEANLGVMLT